VVNTREHQRFDYFYKYSKLNFKMKQLNNNTNYSELTSSKNELIILIYFLSGGLHCFIVVMPITMKLFQQWTRKKMKSRHRFNRTL